MHPFGAALERGDVEAALAQLGDKVTFRSPIVFAQYDGREAVSPLIHAVASVLEDFRYVRELQSVDGNDHALVFQARIGTRSIEGCDFIHVDEDNLVDELVVMVRPLSAALALAESMRALIEPATQ